MIWRNWNLGPLLVERQNGAATVDNSLEAPLEIRNRVTSPGWVAQLVRVLFQYSKGLISHQGT